ncbi:hypothetical protein TcCL_Unassigned04747 [Trypanosoma cruzi]|nr:hypothetical protein TcCL_Unassigned04747 [Trypanosoma cruzi]
MAMALASAGKPRHASRTGGGIIFGGSAPPPALRPRKSHEGKITRFRLSNGSRPRSWLPSPGAAERQLTTKSPGCSCPFGRPYKRPSQKLLPLLAPQWMDPC